MNIPAIVFGWLLASLVGLGFHLIRGGPLTRMALYMVSAWLGFGIGHFSGQWLHVTVLRVGAINFLTALIGALLALLLTDVLSPTEPPTAGGKPPKPLI
ncbi:MAG: hypothetical protein WBR18_09815 [Anaerolineales bacterium]